MPYKVIKSKGKFFVSDNAGIRLPGPGFITKAQARKQQIAVALSQSERQGKPVSFYFDA